MNKIRISDVTMKQTGNVFSLSFREKIEMAKLLDMPVCRIAPFTAAFWPRKVNGHYYSIDLVLDDPDSYETPVVKPKEEPNNISIDDLLEVTE